MNPGLVAKRIIDYYSFDHPDEIVLRDIAADRRLSVQQKDLPNADGYLLLAQKYGTIAVNRSIKHGGRRRFIIAHELGHFELHRNLPREFWYCDASAFIDWHRKRPEETQANEFAAELIMPERLFLNTCSGAEPGIDLVKHLSEHFRTSLTASFIRYATVGHVPAAVICLKNGFVKWYKINPHFPYQYVRTRLSVPGGTAAASVLTGTDVKLKRVELEASVWFDDDAIEKYSYIYEEALSFQEYGIILSLIWMAED